MHLTTGILRCWLLLAAGSPVLHGVLPICLAEPSGEGDGSGDRRIGRLIDELGSPSYGVRTQATKDLIAMGPKAVEALKTAAAGDDFEVALRARGLLVVVDQLLFSGVSVELEASKTAVAWDEPITLTVVLHNRSPHAAHVPVELTTGESATVTDAVRQVTGLLDLADFLQVTGPDGRALALHVDDVNEDEQLLAAVRARAENPVTSDLAPGATVKHVVKAFNRGWARYRLLQLGEHRIQLVYQPVWNDEDLIRAGVGRVTSNVLSITVEKAAPVCIRDARQPARVRLEVSRGQVVASLQNLMDVAVWVNVNVSADQPPPLARLRWFVSCGSQEEQVEFDGGVSNATGVFSRELIKRVPPGGVIELGRRSVSALAGATPRDAGRQDVECGIRVSYSNLAGIVWQRSRVSGLLGDPRAPEGLRTLLPQGMLVTTLSSDRVVLPR